MPLFSSLLRDKGGSPLQAFSEPQKVVNSDLDHSLRYFVIFIFLGGGAALWVSSVLAQFSALPAPSNFWNVGLVAILLLIVMIFQAVLIQSAQFNFVLILLEGIALPAFFYSHFSAWFAIGTGLFVIASLLGFSRARTMIGGALKVNFWSYSTMMMTAAIAALALFLSSLYVGLYQQQGGISYNAYKFVVVSATPGLEYVTPNFNPDTKVDTFLDTTIKGYFDKQEEFNKMPSSSQKAVVAEASVGLLDQITAFTKVVLKPGDTVVSYTFRWVSDGIKTMQEKGLGALVVVGIFFLIFFGIKGVMFFAKWPVIIFCFMLYLLLQAVGLISIGAEMRQKEVIIVK